MTTREQVLKDFREIVTTSVSFKTVRLLHEATLHDIETGSYPMALIFPQAERSHTTQTIGNEIWELDIMVEIWVRGSSSNIEALIGDITKAIYTQLLAKNPNTMFVKRTGIDYLYPEPDLYGARVSFMVIYHHPRGSP